MSLLSERYSDDGMSVVELSDFQKEYIGIYNEKIRAGEYKLRTRKCECGHTDYETIALKDRYGISSGTVICKNCGLIVTSPCLDDESNNSYYDNEYHYIYRAEEKPADIHFLNRKHDAKDIIDFVRKHGRLNEGRVLEIGCADGGNVAAFCECGYNASGIDLSHTYVEFGKEKGLDLYCMDAATFAQRGDRFDLVFLNHVLEHFTDVNRELEIIGKLLKPGGLLFIAVPGVKYLTYGAYYADFLQMLQSAHIYNFTETTLRNVMGINGFECIYANEFIYGLFRKGISTSTIVNAYPDIMEYLRTVETAGGNVAKLLICRVAKILSEYGAGEVLLYGTASELDTLVQNLPDLNSIKGFFYSNQKTPNEVGDYICSTESSNPVKCLLLVDNKNNSSLEESFWDITSKHNVKLYSVYGEIF